MYSIENEEQEAPFAGHGGPSEAESTAGDEQESRRHAPGARTTEDLGTLLRRQTRVRVMEAWRLYSEDPVRHERDLCLAVLEFARKKLYSLEYEFRDRGTAETVDDFAQEVAIEVWETMGGRKRSPATFYAWLNRLCFSKSKDAGKGLRRAVWEKEPLFLSDGNENPLVNRLSNRIDRGCEIPGWLEGTDRLIVELALDGKSYRQIGETLGIPLRTIKNHAGKLKKAAKMRSNSFEFDIEK